VARKLARIPGRSRASKAQVIAEIRAREGKNMSKRLRMACKARFGSIREARAAAGMPSKLKIWSKDMVLEELRRRAARGEPPNGGLRDACRLHFGTLNRAREAAGVPLVRRPWTRDELIAEVRRRRGILDRPFRLKLWVKFGSVDAAYAAAGLAPRRVPWTRERVIAEIQAGRGSRPLRRAAKRYFGSMVKACRAAGREPHPRASDG
jgi:hypothetical protein